MTKEENFSDRPSIGSQKILVVAVSGGIWATQPVSQQPELTLTQWSVREVEDGRRHIVGWCVENREGRVTSKIVSFDPATKRCVTESGRIYQLAGNSGHDSDAEYTWRRWTQICNITNFKDVTDEVDCCK